MSSGCGGFIFFISREISGAGIQKVISSGNENNQLFLMILVKRISVGENHEFFKKT
jgi:hypothetical protein